MSAPAPETPPDSPVDPRAEESRGRRWLAMIGGFFFVGLAWLGVVLPVLPTTPFLLLALWCFSRSSPRLHAGLLRSRHFGPFLRDWHEHRGIRRRTKILALTAVCGVVVVSMLTGGLAPILRGVLIGLAVIGLIVIARLRTIPTGTPVPPLPAEAGPSPR